MITFKEFQKQIQAAERLLKKFNTHNFNASDQAKWLELDIKVREITSKNENERR